MSKFKVGDIVTCREYSKLRIEVRGVGFRSATGAARIVGLVRLTSDGRPPIIQSDTFYDEARLIKEPRTHRATVFTFENELGEVKSRVVEGQSESAWQSTWPSLKLLDVRVIEVELKE